MNGEGAVGTGITIEWEESQAPPPIKAQLKVSTNELRMWPA